MFSGQSEEQARRKILAVLLDETRKVLESARELTNVYKFVTEGKKKDIELSIIKISKAEDEIESFRRALTRELAEVGSIIMNREDLLRTSYEIEEIAGYSSGIAFRLSIIDNKALKKGKIKEEFSELIETSLELVQKLSEMIRTLSTNPSTVMDIAQDMQKIERETDTKYRELVKRVMKEIPDPKNAMMLKDAAEHIEEMADRCLAASDSITVVAIGF
tara:strand:+ start:866 stop:1519 length:654 start_codon:yes stop_codon:yes gene_type:complete